MKGGRERGRKGRKEGGRVKRREGGSVGDTFKHNYNYNLLQIS